MCRSRSRRRTTPPTVTDESFAVTEDTAFSGFLPANDVDGDGLTYSIVTQPANGSVALDDAVTGAFTYTPDPGFNGTDSFTFQVNDGEADSGTATATLEVSSVNDAPSFTAGTDQTVLEDAGAQSLPWATEPNDGDDGTQVLTFSVSNNNEGLFAVQPAIATDGTLTYTPAADANGNALVTVTLSDDGGTANGGGDTSAAAQFTISVESVNDAPAFSAGGNQTVDEDGGAQTVAWAAGISAGPADEAGQVLSPSASRAATPHSLPSNPRSTAQGSSPTPRPPTRTASPQSRFRSPTTAARPTAAPTPRRSRPSTSRSLASTIRRWSSLSSSPSTRTALRPAP